MRKIFTLLLLLAGFTLTAQQYNNEWIQFNQTYYKIKIAKSGIVRIPKNTLDAAGIGGTSVENFELWRNGQQVPFYPSVSTGVLPGNGYLEFWGAPNDGKPDKALYRDPNYQHSDQVSLFTDTAVYFLSVNGNQSGIRIADAVNNVAANVLPVEPYLMYSTRRNYIDKTNSGFAAVVGEYVYSASFDKGELWSTNDIRPAFPLTTSLSSLFVYTGGPGCTLKFGAVGNALNARTVNVKVNNTDVVDTTMDYFNDVNTSKVFPVSLISASTAAVKFTTTSAITSDRMVISYFEINYPRLFNFGNQKNFEFELPAKASGYYLEITNFNTSSVAPVLYDLQNYERYVGDISTAGMVKFALPGSVENRKLVLVNTEVTNATAVTALIPKNFLRFTDAANQGNYLVITNPVLYTGTSGNNPVLDYKAYRESPAGGSYKVAIVDVNEVIDQFAFGVKRHSIAIKNFLRYARTNFSDPMKFVFLVGRGMTYPEYRYYQADPVIDLLNLVPTFGSPGSDNMLASADVLSPIPVTPIGRLSVVSGKEIEDYLEKVKEYELAQKTADNTLEGREWMKNVVHVTGSSDPYLGTVLCNYMGVLKELAEDTVFGAKVTTFCKSSTNPVEQLSSEKLAQLFHEGISVLTYFGHSSSTTLEFNIDNPQSYDNKGKYPVFYVNGCNAGNFFTYYPQRFTVNETLSEKFVLAKRAGSIAFVASTHFGIVNYLNLYLTNLYSVFGYQDVNSTLGEISRDALQQMINATGPYDYYARLHAEEITLHGDPALKLNTQAKPDYIVEPSLIKVNPAFISVAEDNFILKVKIVNLGKSTRDSVRVVIERQYPDGSKGIIFNQKIPDIPYADSLEIEVKIISTRDKGANKIFVTVDADNVVDEISELNNKTEKDFFIYEDEARPAYPYDYAIVNDATQKLYASTANPLSLRKDYIMEIDTSGAFTSSNKISKTVSTTGGSLEFDPGITYTDSTVYHWRISPIPPDGGVYLWHSASFMYINTTSEGFNQSDFYQHTESISKRISIDTTTKKWKFGVSKNNFLIRNGVFPTAANQSGDISITVNLDDKIQSVCGTNNVIFCVFDPVNLQPWFNAPNGQPGKYGSDAICGNGRKYNFQFNIMDTAHRRKIVEFMDMIPNGFFVVVRNVSFVDYNSNTYASDWIKDTSYLGTYNSMYHRLLGQGFTTIDSFNRPRAFIFIYKKNEQGYFQPKTLFSNGINDRITMSADIITPDTLGFITSPAFGPAAKWHDVLWNGESVENPSNDAPMVDVVGQDINNNETKLFTMDKNTHSLDVSSIDPKIYPYLKLKMRNVDSVSLTPYQLKYWRILYDPVPEGALAANIFFTSRDTVDLGEKINFGIAFKNISRTTFDSILVRVTILDRNNVSHKFTLNKYKPLAGGDTIRVMYEVDTKDYPGINTILIDINPDNDQPEHYHYNNFLYHNFYAKVDNTNPLLDVTFDGVHILNRDIVSAKPHIQIKLKDEAKYLLLNDTALSSLEVKYPDGSTHTYKFDNDTLRFIPATSGADNTATIDFTPYFTGQQIHPEGDEYELIVRGKDRSGNKAGTNEFRVAFRIISKPMISNLLNYPNPFSTSTAFVFTITGSELPQNMKIQILTVTGKIVREITMDELGPIHIGRNITDFKWDGTDQYGQKLGNGVYLYRVVSIMNGKPMEKYKAEGDNTDKFFTNGYGKMYLMR
jgi:Peptidase family C25